MRPAKSVGRMIGILLLLQLAGLIIPFILLRPVASEDFLANAAARAFQIKSAVFLLFANCALTICISIVAFPIFREYGPGLALLLVALSVVMFTLQAVDNAHLMSMLSLSESYVRSGSSNDLFQMFSTAARSTRRWIHYSELLAIDAWIFTFYSSLYRARLVPSALAVFGLLTVVLHFAAIPLPLLLGYGGFTALGASMALGHVALAAWLLAKGFVSRPLEGLGHSSEYQRHGVNYAR